MRNAKRIWAMSGQDVGVAPSGREGGKGTDGRVDGVAPSGIRGYLAPAGEGISGTDGRDVGVAPSEEGR